LNQLDPQRYLFCEFFAGEGALTSAMSKAGVPVRSPDDLAGGGTDFQDKQAVDEVRRELGALVTSGVKLMVHFAPPCSTFSRARNRSGRTRLRSDEFPQGFPRCQDKCHSANLIARNTLDLAEWLVREGKAAVSIENPESSMLWAYLDFDPELEMTDVTFSACMFGPPYQKHTRLRCWNWTPASIEHQRCSLVGGFLMW
jgi:hypothetical protein